MVQRGVGEFFRAGVTGCWPGSSATYLGRRISWDEDGISIEGGNKYIQKMLNQWRLERCTSLGARGCGENKR